MAGSTPQPTHTMGYVLLVDGQHFLVLRPLDPEADAVIVSIDEVTAGHLIRYENLDVRPA